MNPIIGKLIPNFFAKGGNIGAKLRSFIQEIGLINVMAHI